MPYDKDEFKSVRVTIIILAIIGSFAVLLKGSLLLGSVMLLISMERAINELF